MVSVLCIEDSFAFLSYKRLMKNNRSGECFVYTVEDSLIIFLSFPKRIMQNNRGGERFVYRR